MRMFSCVLLAALTVSVSNAEEKSEGWTKLFNGKDLEGWMTYPKGTGQWKAEDGAIVGSGNASHLFTKKGDFTDFHLRSEVMINEGGNSGMYFRVKFGPGFPKGYEAQINSTHRDPVKTGSLYGFGRDNEVRKQLIKPGEWFKYEVTVKGNHIVIKVNGKETVNFVDKSNRYEKGHIAFQQHHQGSIVKIRKVEVKPID